MKARLINLMKILVEATEVMTIKELAKKLEISNKTVRNDLSVCEPYLKDMNITLIKKSGVGIYIDADEEVKLEALCKIKRHTVGLMGYGSLQRQLFILKKLLFSKMKISFNWLEMNLYVSKPSIYKDIAAAESWLKDRDIELIKDKYGRYDLKSGEKRIRKAIFDWRSYCIKSLNQADLDEMIKDTYIGRTYSLERSRHVVRKIESVFQIKFVPEDFKGLVIKLSIITERMQDGHYVTLNRDTLGRLSQLRTFRHIDLISQYIKSNYHILFTESEKGYLLGLIVSLNIYEGADDWNIDESYITLNHDITEEIVDIISTQLYVLQDNREAIYKRVFAPVKTLVNQIHYGLYSFHTIADIIDNNYTTLNKIVDAIEPIFTRNLGYDFTISDKGDWLIILAELVEESKTPLEGVFVYSHKFTDANLTITTLKNNFSQLKINTIIPIDSYKDYDLADFDLVFIDESYEDILSSNDHVIVLPPLLSFADKITLFDRICKYYEEVNFTNIKKIYP